MNVLVVTSVRIPQKKRGRIREGQLMFCESMASWKVVLLLSFCLCALIQDTNKTKMRKLLKSYHKIAKQSGPGGQSNIVYIQEGRGDKTWVKVITDGGNS